MKQGVLDKVPNYIFTKTKEKKNKGGGFVDDRHTHHVTPKVMCKGIVAAVTHSRHRPVLTQ